TRGACWVRESACAWRAGGEVVARPILMEAPSDSEAKPPGPAPPEELSPEALRALADLEETRRRGDLTENEYQTRRKAILSGQLPEPSPPATGAPAPSAPAAAGPSAPASKEPGARIPPGRRASPCPPL